jgi:hypothetical protein
MFALVAAAVACATAAAPAQAGEYTYYACKGPNGQSLPLNSTEWKLGYSAGGAAANGCDGASGLALFMGPGGTAWGIGTVAVWRVSPPFPSGGVLIKSVRARYAVKSTWAGHDMSASPAFTVAGDRTAIATCAAFQGCNVGDINHPDGTAQVDTWTPTAPVYEMTFEVQCGGSIGGYCANEPDAARMVAALGRLQFTLVDKEYPTTTVPTGDALNQSALKGTVHARFSVTDVGSGVYDYTTQVDGVVVGHGIPNANGGACADLNPGNADSLEFAAMVPCVRDVDVDAAIDTTKLDDGPHKLTVDVRDAAGNTRHPVDLAITVDNVPPPSVATKPSVAGVPAGGLRPNDTLTAREGVWVGSGIQFKYRWQRSSVAGVWADIANATGPNYTVATADVGASLRVVVTGTNREGSADGVSEATPVVASGATVQVSSLPPGSAGATGNGAGGDTSTGQLVLDREQRTVDVAYGAKIVITGKLVDADSDPIANAQVDVFEQIAKTAAAWNKIGTVTTDSQGGYVYRPKTTASRRLRFAYSDKRDAADYRATREVFVSVTAGMTVKARHRVIARRGLLRLSGQVSLEGLPAKGTWIEVQVLDDGVWRAVATRPVSAKGHWSYRHRMTLAARTSFAFRSRLRPTGELPSAEAKSAPVKVRVR